jgi:hypothetical protein
MNWFKKIVQYELMNRKKQEIFSQVGMILLKEKEIIKFKKNSKKLFLNKIPKNSKIKKFKLTNKINKTF